MRFSESKNNPSLSEDTRCEPVGSPVMWRNLPKASPSTRCRIEERILPRMLVRLSNPLINQFIMSQDKPRKKSRLILMLPTIRFTDSGMSKFACLTKRVTRQSQRISREARPLTICTVLDSEIARKRSVKNLLPKHTKTHSMKITEKIRPLRHKTNMKATRSSFSCFVSFSSRTRLKNSTVSCSVGHLPS